MKKNLTIFERAVKNKEKFKLQLISLALATTAIISTGCASSKTPTQDDAKPGIEEVVNDYSKEELKIEEVEPLTAANFEFEVDKLMASLQEKGMEISRKEAGTLLLYNNMCEITANDHMTIVSNSFNNLADDGYDIGYAEDYKNNITKYNYRATTEDYIELAQLTCNPKGKSILNFFDELNIRLKSDIINGSGNLKNEINDICDFAHKFCNNEAYLMVDGEEVYLTDNVASVQLLVGRSVLDLSNTVRQYDSNNKWVGLLSGAGCNDYINSALDVLLEYDPYNPQMSK